MTMGKRGIRRGGGYVKWGGGGGNLSPLRERKQFQYLSRRLSVRNCKRGGVGVAAGPPCAMAPGVRALWKVHRTFQSVSGGPGAHPIGEADVIRNCRARQGSKSV